MSPIPILRSLVRARGITTASVAMLALGVGALTTTFGIADAALLRQPPFAEPDRLAILYITRTSGADAPHRERWSYPRLTLLSQLATSFGSLANYSLATLTLTGDGDAETIDGEIAAPAYFTLLKVRPVRGRTFLPNEDDAAGTHPIAVLGYDLWLRRFHGDSTVVGRKIVVQGAPLTIVGVLPRGFRGLSDRAQLWIPTTMAPALTYADYLKTNQNFISVVGRLAPGTPLARAQAELSALGTRINEAIPSAPADNGLPESLSATAVPLNEARVDTTMERSIFVLLAAVALLHVLACANVTNLLLGRAAARRREAAVRTALGSGRGRLLRLYLAEGVVLAMSGGVLGVVIAAWASSVIVVPADLWGARGFYGNLARFDAPGFSMRVALFGAGLTLVTTVLVAWAPAATMIRTDILEGLRAGARGIAPGSGTLRRPTLRGAIVALEAALAVVLLVAGSLMIASFGRMRRTSLGVNPERVLTFLVRPSEIRVPPAQAPQFITRMLEAITRVPGVVSASVDGGAPVSGSARSVVHVVGAPVVPDGLAPPVNRHYVAADHFTTLGIPVVSGRTFRATDDARSPKITIVSASAARRFWPGEDPIGRRVWFGSGSGSWSADSTAEVVGVVGDIANDPVDQRRSHEDFYTPYRQFTYAWRWYFVRTSGDPLAVLPAIRRAVAGVDPDVPLTDVKPLGEVIGASWARHRFDAWLFGAFATVAILLAVAGIYAVVAYAVSTRTREMGIRLALGAQPSAIVRLVVSEGMAFPAIGVLAGVVASLASAQLLRASLYEITPSDPVILGGTVVLLLVVAAVACVVPGRRATRVDPVEALRAE